MDLGLNGRVAIVTGASRGLGRAIDDTRFVTGSGWLIDGGELTGL